MTDQLPVLDSDALDELRAGVGGDDAFLADLAQTYLAEGAQHMAEIEAAGSAGDLGAIVRPAHSMKSSSASLGAARMSELSRQIEFAGREERADVIPGLVEAARQAWDATVVELRARGLVQ